MKWDLSNCSFNQPAPSSASATAAVERSLSTACAAAQHSSLLLRVAPCVTLAGVISAISSLRSDKI